MTQLHDTIEDCLLAIDKCKKKCTLERFYSHSPAIGNVQIEHFPLSMLFF